MKEDLRRRRSAFQDVTLADRQARHDKVAAEKAHVLEERRRLGSEYLAAHPPTITVGRDRGVTTAALIEESRAAREEAAALNVDRTTDVHNGALEFPVLGEEFAADGPVIAFGTSPLVLAPVVEYLGMVPVLFNLFVTRAHQTTFQPDTAHRFHLDPEDTWSFKVFVHLTDVDEDCGPFHALPASLSETVLEKVDYRGVTMLDDSVVDDLVGIDNVVAALGPAGTCAFADTTRCLHFGGRPRAEGKPVREMVVYQYLLPTSMLLTGEHATSPRRFLPQLAATGDPTWDALQGETLV